MPELETSILGLPEEAAVQAGDYVEIDGPGGSRRLAVSAIGGGGSGGGGALVLSVAIPAGAETVVVEFPSPLGAAPDGILCSITKPQGGDSIWANPVAESITVAGFTAALSGAPAIAGHILVCQILSNGGGAGTVAIPAGAETVVVEFPSPLGAAPDGILCSITKPQGGDSIWANPVAGSITAAGFTADLSGAPAIAGHILVYQLL
ncbi:hypothetical protein OpiT1DRAFT_01236 [Opitutaceae bacterium TAV1]|nr:hypothetical protein OpiT1DRAFT_01236 [Opitutaceae bacterium TAV1]